MHSRAPTRGAWVVDPAHWDGLPDGAGRATVVESAGPGRAPDPRSPDPGPDPLGALLARNHAAATPVARRPLSTYQRAAAAAAGGPR